MSFKTATVHRPLFLLILCFICCGQIAFANNAQAVDEFRYSSSLDFINEEDFEHPFVQHQITLAAIFSSQDQQNEHLIHTFEEEESDNFLLVRRNRSSTGVFIKTCTLPVLIYSSQCKVFGFNATFRIPIFREKAHIHLYRLF